ncbi:hypothetical protein L1987_64351 [Smallanthus sonchifolius]|uniref:Uncharacterized protein n=1 Tax=Smallanthus sonchifolius TaxID=185202 RepID=A0ACB9CFQ6_9ASTR|nr:hypothetical protein L1987_64351 [Smallanthus sonchifolius]
MELNQACVKMEHILGCPGFQFDVANAKSTPQPENSSPMDLRIHIQIPGKRYEADLGARLPNNPLAYAHSEDESAKSPAGSPSTQKIFESLTKEDSFSHFGKNFDAETDNMEIGELFLWLQVRNETKKKIGVLRIS